jgi:hypothetical protein
LPNPCSKRSSSCAGIRPSLNTSASLGKADTYKELIGKRRTQKRRPSEKEAKRQERGKTPSEIESKVVKLCRNFTTPHLQFGERSRTL